MVGWTCVAKRSSCLARRVDRVRNETWFDVDGRGGDLGFETVRGDDSPWQPSRERVGWVRVQVVDQQLWQQSAEVDWLSVKPHLELVLDPDSRRTDSLGAAHRTRHRSQST